MTELEFRTDEEPYLFAAAMRRQLGDEVLEAVYLVPSPSGPAVAIRDDLLADEDVLGLLTLLEGTIARA